MAEEPPWNGQWKNISLCVCVCVCGGGGGGGGGEGRGEGGLNHVKSI